MEKKTEILKSLLNQIVTSPISPDITEATFQTLIAQLLGKIPWNSQLISFQSYYNLYNKNNIQKHELEINNSLECIDKKRILERLGSFKWKESIEWKEICKIYGKEPSKNQLLQWAHKISQNNSLNIDRDSKRRKSVLIKWFHENWKIAKQSISLINMLE